MWTRALHYIDRVETRPTSCGRVHLALRRLRGGPFRKRYELLSFRKTFFTPFGYRSRAIASRSRARPALRMCCYETYPRLYVMINDRSVYAFVYHNDTIIIQYTLTRPRQVVRRIVSSRLVFFLLFLLFKRFSH